MSAGGARDDEDAAGGRGGNDESAGERAKVLVVPGNTHGEAYRDGKPAYESAVAELLHEAAAGPPTRLASGRPN